MLLFCHKSRSLQLKIMKIGFIGLGNLGSVLVDNLIQKNRKIHLHNRTIEKMLPYKKDAVLYSRIPSIAYHCDILISSLLDDKAVESISYGSAGIIENMKPGSVFVNLSTIASSTATKLALAYKEKQLEYVTATIIGRPEAAVLRSLTVCVSGTSKLKSEIFELLEDMGGKAIYDFGDDPATAAIIKISNNFLLTAAVEAMSEIFTVLQKSGTDPNSFYKMITETLFNSPAYKNYGKIIIDEDYEQVGAASQLGLKDVKLALKLADEVSATMPMADILKNHFIMNHNRGRFNADWTTLAKVINENNN
jgi:3-hydroxyisobutyrate dehydrogenase-like beta-hydroxyacid dehydrogenase